MENEPIHTDICVIGAGSGGLSVAAGAAQMGASTVLVEKGRMGGDCLNYGCVPSKALLAAAHAAETMRGAETFGVTGGPPVVDFSRVHDHVAGVIAAIAPHDSQQRFEELGVQVIREAARFTGLREVTAGGHAIRARRFVIATGSSPLVPPIVGLEDALFLTNESLFDLVSVPGHLIIIGGGPIGVEMAQAHRRLGAKVSVVEMFTILPHDDPELVDVVRSRLAAEGVAFHEGVTAKKIESTSGGVAVVVEKDGYEQRIEGSHLLVAAGRQANVEGLGLEAAGVGCSPKGITVDRRLRTSNRRVFAIGDVVGGYQFTHMAGYHAGIVLRNVFFRLPAKVDHSAVPWVTYSDPGLAHVGLSESQAREKHGSVTVLRKLFAENDRARTEGDSEGLIKVVVTKKGKILGASMVGAGAGELIHVWALALSQGLKIGAMAGYLAPYPTRGEISKHVAGSFFTPKLFGPGTRALVQFFGRFG